MRVSFQFTFLLAATCIAAPTVAQDSRALAQENYQQADANDDGKLSPAEFRIFIDENAKDELGRAAMVKRMGLYDRAFTRLDANDDGFVSRSELAAARDR